MLFPFPWESHGTHGIPAFPIPMHISTLDYTVLSRRTCSYDVVKELEESGAGGAAG